MLAENDNIGCAGDHGRRRHSHLRDDDSDVPELRAQVVDQGLRCLEGPTWTVQDEVKAGIRQTVYHLHDALEVFIDYRDELRRDLGIGLGPLRRIQDHIAAGVPMRSKKVLPSDTIEIRLAPLRSGLPEFIQDPAPRGHAVTART
jgi:hypothetical protein